jgi:DNA (cytosine-5)-methyltransferase 1
MKSNNYFYHTTHFHKDIKAMNAKDFTNYKENNPEKLILVGGPPCQPFSKKQDIGKLTMGGDDQEI